MSKKTYLAIRLGIIMCLSATIAFATEKHLWYLSITAMIAAMAILWALSKKTNYVTADERDYKIAGLAARYTYTIYSFTMVIIGLITLSMSDSQPQLQVIGNTLLYSTCALLILYSVLFKIYSRNGEE